VKSQPANLALIN